MSVVFRGVTASWFDDTETASGQSAATTVGVALPLPSDPDCANSLCPDWVTMGTWVRVYVPTTGAMLETQVIDIGPNTEELGPERGIDLSAPALAALGLDPGVGLYTVDVRIFTGDPTDEGK